MINLTVWRGSLSDRFLMEMFIDAGSVGPPEATSQIVNDVYVQLTSGNTPRCRVVGFTLNESTRTWVLENKP